MSLFSIYFFEFNRHLLKNLSINQIFPTFKISMHYNWETAHGMSVKSKRMFDELSQDKLLLSLSALVSIIWTSDRSLLCLMLHLLHFTAVSAVPCGWERSAPALCGADCSALTCILKFFIFPSLYTDNFLHRSLLNVIHRVFSFTTMFLVDFL